MKLYKDFQPTSFNPLESNANIVGLDWLVIDVMQTRDSGALFVSNFTTALKLLGGESDDVVVHRFGHWAVGWFEIITINPNATDKVAIANKIEQDLLDYPILDEDEYSRMQFELGEIDTEDDEL